MKHKLRKLLAMVMTLCMIVPVLATGAAAVPFMETDGQIALICAYSTKML